MTSMPVMRRASNCSLLFEMNRVQVRRTHQREVVLPTWNLNLVYSALRILLSILAIFILIFTVPELIKVCQKEYGFLLDHLQSPPAQLLHPSQIAEDPSRLILPGVVLFIIAVTFIRTKYAILAVTFCFLTWLPVQVLGLLTLGSYWTGYLHTIFNYISSLPNWWLTFVTLFTFKYFKVAIHTLSYNYFYYPTAPRSNPTLKSKDLTVIIPTVGDLDIEFAECVLSIFYNQPAEIIVSTVGADKLARAKEVCAAICTTAHIPAERIRCIAVSRPSKRVQLAAALKLVKTRIVALVDDHVFWPTTLSTSVLANFEDPAVGHVGTVKRVRRQHPEFPPPATLRGIWEWISDDFRNYIACIYLERHNFECTAASAIDGGLFVLSGRTAFLRSSIVTDPVFMRAYTSETWAGKGPMNVDDDNFITRYMVKNGFKTVFHNTPSAMVETTLGTGGGWKKFNGQLLRWARTTWRSNYTTLFVDRVVWRSQPWSVLFVYFASFVNLSSFYDTALFVTLWKSGGTGRHTTMLWLAGAILASKMVKPLPHWLREPRDIFYLPAGVLFAYYHSLVKVWTLWTVDDIAWGTRAGVDDAGPDSAPVIDLTNGEVASSWVNGGDQGSEGKSRQEDKHKLLDLARRMRTVAQKATNEAILAERQALRYVHTEQEKDRAEHAQFEADVRPRGVGTI